MDNTEIQNNEVQNNETENKELHTDSSIENNSNNTNNDNLDTQEIDYSKNVAKRINKLTSKLSEKDAELQQLRAQLESKQTAPAPIEAPSKPKLEDFATIDEFTDAMTDYKFNQRQVQAQQQAAVDNKFKAYNNRIEEFKKASGAEDFVLAVQEINDQLVKDNNIAEFIIESDVGPAIAYHLANNEEALDKLMGLSGVRRIAYLTKLEAQFENKKASKDEPKTKATISRVTTNAASTNSSSNDSSYTKWKQQRQAALKKK